MKMAKSIILLCFLAWMQIAIAGETVRITTGEFSPWTSAALKHQGFTNRVIR